MTYYSLSDASIKIYERDNVLVSNFRGKLTPENLEYSLKIWSTNLLKSHVDLIFADFSEALVESSSPLLSSADADKNLYSLKEITINTPKELCSRILFKNLMSEYKATRGFKKLNLRFVDEATFTPNVEKTLH